MRSQHPSPLSGQPASSNLSLKRVNQCIVRPHAGGGLFSLINKVMTCMELYATVCVDFAPHESLYKSAEGDLWSTLFYPSGASIDFDEPFDIVVKYPHSRYTHRNAGNRYILQDGWRERLNSHYRKLKVRKEVLKLSESVLDYRICSSVSILYRGERALAMEQRTQVHPSPEQMCAQLDQLGFDGPVFVSADSTEAQDRFRSILGNRMQSWLDVERCQRIGQSPHFRSAFGSDHIRKMLALALVLSRTRHLIHAVSNIATAVLYINPALPHTFVEVENN